MLQSIHEIYPTAKASSLYCVWATRDGTANSPLIAVWIDPSMRVFEGEMSLNAQTETEEVSSDDPGGWALTSARPGSESTEEMGDF
jgi:hypothetical protein